VRALRSGSQANTSRTIIWIDDNRDQLRSTMESIGLYHGRSIPEGELSGASISIYLDEPEFRIIGMQPLADMDEYVELIVKEKVTALVADEKLREQAISGEGGKHVSYDGHDLIQYVRSRLRRLPLFVVTAYTDEPALSDMRGEYEFAMDRQEFNSDPAKHLKPIFRAAGDFLNTHESRLEELTDIARKIAAGKSDANDISRMKAIEAALGIDHPIVDTVVADHLSTLEWHMDEFEAVLAELEGALDEARKDE
jgi:hypothetical protein